MRRSSARALAAPALLALLPLGLLPLAGCRSTAPDESELPARRDDVTLALYRQLDLVLARRAELADEPDAARERERLTRLAGEIALRIARIDADADVRALLERIEPAEASA